MTHKEFYIWLEGYLTGKLENKNIDIFKVLEKIVRPLCDVNKIKMFERAVAF